MIQSTHEPVNRLPVGLHKTVRKFQRKDTYRRGECGDSWMPERTTEGKVVEALSYLFICLSVCLPICPPVQLFIFLSICLSVSLSTGLPVYLSICLFVYLSHYLSNYLPVCLPICFFIFSYFHLFMF